MSWSGPDSRVTTEILDDAGRPVGTPDPAALIRAGLLYPWEVDVPSRARTSMGRALFPPRVRAYVADRSDGLGPGRHLRLSLLLPRADEGGHPDLAALRWEAVPLPSATALPAAWQAWAAGEEPDEGCELGRHPWFTLVRRMAADTAPPSWTAPGIGLVVVADATSVHGPIHTPGGAQTVPEPASGAQGDRDTRLVEGALRGSRLMTRTVPGPATAESIRRQLVPGARVFYFGGHQTAGGLVVADASGGAKAEWLGSGALADWLRDSGVRLAVLMACDSAGVDGSASSAVSAAERLVRAGVPHVVAVQGKVSHRQAASFAREFFAALAHGTEIDLALRRGAQALDGASAVPVHFAHHLDASMSVDLLPERRDAVLASAAHRLSVGSEAHAGVRLPDERFRVHLETRWCLAPDPVLDVLADPTADDLPGLLNDSESVLHQARDAASHPYEERRYWYVCDAPRGRVPRTEAELRGAVSPPFKEPRHAAGSVPGRGIGLVVRRHAALAVGPELRDDLEHLHRFGWDLRCVVVQVYGERADAVQQATERIARLLGLSEYVVRERSSRIGPLAPPALLPPSLPGPPTTPGPEQAASELLDRVRAAQGDWDPGPAPAVDAPAVVRHLNDRPVWGNPSAESAVLAVVRTFWPSVYRELSAALASARRGPARAVSLLLAAERDGDLVHWLRSAGAALPVPSDFPPFGLPDGFADSMVLAMVRAGLRETVAFDDWWQDDVSTGVRTALGASERGTSGLSGADLERADVVVALDRADLIGPADLRLLDPRGQFPGSWPLLTRRRLTEATAEWLYGLGPERRRLLGLGPARGPYDLELEEQLAVHRQALRPPLPRS